MVVAWRCQVGERQSYEYRSAVCSIRTRRVVPFSHGGAAELSEWKPEIQPDSMLDDLRREPMPGVGDFEHSSTLPRR